MSRSVSSLDRDDEPLSSSSRTIPPTIPEKLIATPHEDVVQNIVNEQIPPQQNEVQTPSQQLSQLQPQVQQQQQQQPLQKPQKPQVAQKPLQPPPLPPTKPVIVDSTQHLQSTNNALSLVNPQDSTLVLVKEKSTQEKVSKYLQQLIIDFC